MKVWLEEEGEGMRMKRGELEMARESQQEEEEHVLISVMASVMIYQACIILLSVVILVCFIWIRNCFGLPT